MAAWSIFLWSHFDLTWDYSIYHQAWWLIAHGHLDPYDTPLGLRFSQNNFELFLWVLAPVGLIFPHGPVLPVLQDLALVVAEGVVWTWANEAIEGYAVRYTGWSNRLTHGIAATGLVLLLANPWTWWAISFDVHMELFGVCLVTLTARALWRHRRSGWLWAVLAVSCGSQVAVWVVGLGIGLFLVNRKRWRQALGLAAIGAGWLLLAVVLHQDRGGNPVGLYGHLVGIAPTAKVSTFSLLARVGAHPGSVLDAILSHLRNDYANIAPDGIIGVFFPLLIGMTALQLLTVDLVSGQSFAQPSFQNIVVYVFVPLGTVFFLLWIARSRRQQMTLAIGALLSVNTLLWGFVFFPRLAPTWSDVSAPAAQLLSQVRREIPTDDEVVASQGVAGRFSDRQWIYPVTTAGQVIPLDTPVSWWVVTPRVGIETVPAAQEDELVYLLATRWHAQLVVADHGVWVFRWVRPHGLQSVTIPNTSRGLPGWVVPGPAGRLVVSGPVDTWVVESTGMSGYVVAQDYFSLEKGSYRATVTLASSVPVNVEVWNDTSGQLLARRSLPATEGYRTVQFAFGLRKLAPSKVFHGVGPFTIDPVPPRRGNQIEIRVWTAGGGVTTVSWIQIGRGG